MPYIDGIYVEDIDASLRPAVDPTPWRLFDDFDRPNQGGLAANDIGRDRTGKLWLTTGSSWPAVRGNRMDTTFNSYAYVDLLRPPSTIMADLVLDPSDGVVTPTWALIWTDTMNIPTWNCIHLSCQPTGTALTVYEAGISRAPAVGGGFVLYSRPLVRDGRTPNRMSLHRKGDTLVMDFGEGNTRIATDPVIGSFTGSLVVYQLGRSGGSGDRRGSTFERVGALGIH